MNLTLTGGTSQQRQWFQDAVANAGYPFNETPVAVEIRWGDPSTLDPTGNHSDFACTQEQGDGSFLTVIRTDLDQPGRDTQYGHLFEGKDFYEETCIHELGHVMQFHLADAAADHDAFCTMFGAPTAQWSPAGAAWQNQIKESVAETFKDLFLTERKFDNRTLYKLPQTEVSAFVGKLGSVAGADLTHRHYDGHLGGVAVDNPWWPGGIG